MNTFTARPLHRPQIRPHVPLRLRATLPAIIAPPAERARACENDFLVANPRPDLTTDPQLMRMIER